MAANVIVLTDEQWAVIGPVIARLGEGGILVPPRAAEDFKQAVGKPVPDEAMIAYEFGGQPDIVVDVMHSISGFAADAIIKHLKENPDE